MTHTYDGIGRLTKVASTEGTVNYAYDDLDRQTAVWTGNGTRTEYTYDLLNRLHTVRSVERFGVDLSATPDVTTYTYDTPGNLDLVEQSNGVITDYVYDALNRLELLTHYAPEDGTGDTTSHLDNEQLAIYDYELNLDGSRAGVVETIEPVADRRVELTLDNGDAAVVETGTWTQSTSPNAIDGDFLATGATNGSRQAFYDSLAGGLERGEYEVFFHYLGNSARSTNVPVDVVHAGGTTTVTVDQQALGNGGHWISLGTFTFTGDPGSGEGVRVRTDAVNGTTSADAVRFTPTAGPTTQITAITWEYDDLNRLIGESYDAGNNGASAGDYETTYTYDLTGNRLEKATDTYDADSNLDGAADQTVTYVVDTNDRLLSETLDDVNDNNNDRHTVYTYDADGVINLTGGDDTVQTDKTVYQGLDDTGTKLTETTYSYDARGRMSKVEIDNGADGSIDTTTEYAYDDNGIKVSMTVDGTTTTLYLTDHNNHTGYAQTIEEGVDDNGNGVLDAAEVDKTYVIGHDVIAQAAAELLDDGRIQEAAQQLLTFLYDGHGSTRALLNEAFEIAQKYAYDAYGVQLTGTQLTSAAAAFTSLLYSGEHFDAKVQMQYLRARWYDAASGRFNRVDPFAGSPSDPQSLHKYLYAHSNPITHVDPSGLFVGRFATAKAFITTLILNLATTYSAIIIGTANAVNSRTTAPDGFVLNLGYGGQASGFAGGVIVSILFLPRVTLVPQVFITAEAGIAPLSRIRNWRGHGVTWSFGGVWGVKSIGDFEGATVTANWPLQLTTVLIGANNPLSQTFSLKTIRSRLAAFTRYATGSYVSRQGVVSVGVGLGGTASVAVGAKGYNFSWTVGYTKHIGALARGITSAASAFWNKVKQVAGQIWDWVKKTSNQAWDTGHNIYRMLLSSL